MPRFPALLLFLTICIVSTAQLSYTASYTR